jgi:histidyl-tRNA synthetase
VLIANFGDESLKYQIEALSKLRSAGIGSEMYYEPDKIAKQFKFADKLGVPIVLIFGPEEISKNLVTIKNLKTREQKIIPVSEMLEVVKSLV